MQWMRNLFMEVGVVQRAVRSAAKACATMHMRATSEEPCRESKSKLSCINFLKSDASWIGTRFAEIYTRPICPLFLFERN